MPCSWCHAISHCTTLRQQQQQQNNYLAMRCAFECNVGFYFCLPLVLALSLSRCLSTLYRSLHSTVSTPSLARSFRILCQLCNCVKRKFDCDFILFFNSFSNSTFLAGLSSPNATKMTAFDLWLNLKRCKQKPRFFSFFYRVICSEALLILFWLNVALKLKSMSKFERKKAAKYRKPNRTLCITKCNETDFLAFVDKLQWEGLD